MRYRDAGVDIARSDALKEAIGIEVRSTWGPGVRPIPGGFAGLMNWPDPRANGFLLAATLDGVGTKLHLAQAAGRLADAAADVVYHGANDLLAHGARPVALLDYIAQARLDSAVVLEVVRGLALGCREVGAVLLGGETAEMPDTYLPGVVDVAGCLIGAARPEGVLDGSRVRPGDHVLGLAAAGLHTNGFSLTRRVLAASGLKLSDPLPGGAGETAGAALLAPHRWYGPALDAALDAGALRALAHVTGGGIAGNLIRVLPAGCCAVVHETWERPAVFRWLIAAGAVPEEDARTALNLGIGMIVVCAPEWREPVCAWAQSAGERVFEIGRIEAGERGVTWG
ncbi:MAG: phosphoribosylformylglycinamidine cyclo-ligase [Candidatus Eisenbacteria bacterium]